VRFLGPKPYHELASYARSFDAAVLPYLKREPTYSGSSTRFYEHLAACRPMFATRGFAELLNKEPLVRLVDDAQELARLLEGLRRSSFVDGLERDRWAASRGQTWEARASRLRAELTRRIEHRV
jgi:glycosyltransferase involved in cell wall biosynthesis